MDDLVTGIHVAMPGLIEGVYLTGSIPLNDFYPNKSDVDFIVLCRSLPSQEIILPLERLHNSISKRFKKTPLSGFYITKQCLQLSVGQTTKVLGVHEGKIRETFWGDGLTAITLKELRSTSFTISGMPVRSLPIEVCHDQINQALLENINSYWRKWINKHTYLPHRFSLLLFFPWFTEWAVLGVARQLYTLQTGSITSKRMAGQFALNNLPLKYKPIIQKAMKIRAGCTQFHFAPSVQRARQTIRCVNFMIDKFNEDYKQKYMMEKLPLYHSGL